MADVFSFIQQGWKSIWKQRYIWLFSSLPLLDQLYRAAQIKHDSNIFMLLFAIMEGSIAIILYFTSFIGVLYLAYCSSIGKIVTIQETLFAIRKFAKRIIGCSCLGFFIALPSIFLLLVISINNSTQPAQISNKMLLMSLPFSIFTAIWDFAMFGFFANDWNIRQTLKNAWTLFTAHFGNLAILGLLMIVAFRIYSAAFGALWMLLESGFDITTLSQLNYINPLTSLSDNLLFVAINGIVQIIYTPFSVSVFAYAYLKYSGVKIPSSAKIARNSH